MTKDVTVISVLIPVRTESEANRREHWAKRARRTKEQREAAAMLCKRFKNLPKYYKRLTITLTRIAPRKLDSDNLARSMKAVRDGIADALGLDDGSDRLEWLYEQEKGKPKEYSVMVTVEGKA